MKSRVFAMLVLIDMEALLIYYKAYVYEIWHISSCESLVSVTILVNSFQIMCNRPNLLVGEHEFHSRKYYLVITGDISVGSQARLSQEWYCYFWRNGPRWSRASSFTRFLDHARHTTVGRTSLDE
jgi:hypothetical protein